MERTVTPDFRNGSSWTKDGQIEVLSVGEAAQRMRLSSMRVRQLTNPSDPNSGELSPVALVNGRQWLYSAQDVERVTERRKERFKAIRWLRGERG